MAYFQDQGALHWQTAGVSFVLIWLYCFTLCNKCAWDCIYLHFVLTAKSAVKMQKKLFIFSLTECSESLWQIKLVCQWITSRLLSRLFPEPICASETGCFISAGSLTALIKLQQMSEWPRPQCWTLPQCLLMSDKQINIEK